MVRDLAHDVRLPGRRARPSDLERDDRQPRGAVGGARAAPGQGDRVRHQRPLHPLAHVRGARRRGPRHRRPRGGGARGRVGTVVVTAGTTGLGTVDAVEEAVTLARASTASASTSTPPTAASSRCSTSSSRCASFRAIADADSVVVDPHKHGLQPYGCGAVLFRDPGVGRLYKHDSPVHLLHQRRPAPRRDLARVLTRRRGRGRPVADAALARPRADPLRRRPRRPRLGGPAARLRRAAPARRAAARHRQLLPGPPARLGDRRRERAHPQRRHDRGDPVFLSTLRIDGAAFAAAHPDVEMDTDGVRVLRSVLMKPEHEPHVPWLHERVTAISRR